jgi:hypothetical protein
MAVTGAGAVWGDGCIEPAEAHIIHHLERQLHNRTASRGSGPVGMQVEEQQSWWPSPPAFPFPLAPSVCCTVTMNPAGGWRHSFPSLPTRPTPRPRGGSALLSREYSPLVRKKWPLWLLHPKEMLAGRDLARPLHFPEHCGILSESQGQDRGAESKAPFPALPLHAVSVGQTPHPLRDLSCVTQGSHIQ